MSGPTTVPRNSYSINQQVRHFENAGAPTNGTNGTYAGIAEAGALLVDVTNLAVFINSNTQASPTWTRLSALLTGQATFAAVAASTTGSVTVNSTAVSASSVIEVTPYNANADTQGIVVAWVDSISPGVSFTIKYRNISGSAMLQAWAGNYRILS